MTTFEDREKAEEARQVLKEELRFKAEARRNRLFGLWAAERMNHAEPAAYAAEIVSLAFGSRGQAQIVAKVHADLLAATVPVAVPAVQARYDELAEVAADQVLAEVRSG